MRGLSVSVAWLYGLSTWKLATMFVGGVVVLADAAVLVTRRWVHYHWGESREVVGHFLAATGTIYAVLLAMIAVAAWQNISDVNAMAIDEASHALNLYRDLDGLPSPTRERARGMVRDYVEVVLKTEWPEMRRGHPSRASNTVTDALFAEIVHFQPTSLSEATHYAEAFRVTNRLLDLRRKRLMAIDEALPFELWFVVLGGGVLTLGLSLLVTTRDVRLDLLLTSAYAAMTGMMIFLISAMDHPLWGEFSVRPDAFQYAQTSMDRLDRVGRAPTNSSGTLARGPISGQR